MDNHVIVYSNPMAGRFTIEANNSEKQNMQMPDQTGRLFG